MWPLYKCSLISAIPLAITAILAAPGCNTVPAEKFQRVQRELQAADEEIRMLQTEVSAQEETIRSLTAQIEEIRNVGGDPAQMLVVPERIQLAAMSGGYDDDGKVGDDGIVLYVQPIDRDRHVVKAAGTVTVKLLDPLNPPGGVDFARYHFDWKHTREMWYGRLLTHHFTVKCPWPEGHLPTHNEIIAHVVFTELITGKSLTATGTYKITFPPERTTAIR